MKKLYALVALLLVGTAVAQPYNYTIYNTNNSNIANTNYHDIAAEANGTLWLASYGGLSKFDGTTFTHYYPENSPMPTSAVLKVCVDGLNRKWISTAQNGIVRFDGTNWINYTTANSGLPTNVIADIDVDASNNLWVATSLGLVKFNGTTWTTYNNNNSNVFSNDVSDIAVAGNNVYLINSGVVLTKFNGSTFSIVTDGAAKIYKARNNEVYTWSEYGFTKFVNDQWAASYNYFNGGGCLADCQLAAMDFDENNKQWIAYQRECANGGVQNFTDCTAYTSGGNAEFNYLSSLKVQNSNLIWFYVAEVGLVKMYRNPLSVSQNTLENNAATLYPNPTQGTFSVSGAAGAFQYQVLDLTGKMLASGTANYNTAVDVAGLASGTYVVKTIGTDINQNFKLIKQ